MSTNTAASEVTTSDPKENASAKIYFAHPKFQYLGLICALFFMFVPGAFAFIWVRRFPNEPWWHIALCAAGIAVAMSPFAVAGIGLMIWSRRFRLIINNDAICTKGLFGEKLVLLSTVERLDWLPVWGPYLYGPFGKSSVDVSNLKFADRVEVSEFLRQRIDPALQSDQRGYEAWFFPTPAARRKLLLVKLAITFPILICLLVAWLLGVPEQPLFVMVLGLIGHEVTDWIGRL